MRNAPLDFGDIIGGLILFIGGIAALFMGAILDAITSEAMAAETSRTAPHGGDPWLAAFMIGLALLAVFLIFRRAVSEGNAERERDETRDENRN